MHVFRRKTEDGRKFVANVGDPLGLVPQRQSVTLPARDRGMRLQGVVLLSRNEVFGVDLCGGSGQRSFRIASASVGGNCCISEKTGIRRHSMLKPAGKVQARTFRGILDANQQRSILRPVERLRHYDRDWLAIEPDNIILQNVQSFTGGIQGALELSIRELGRVEM